MIINYLNAKQGQSEVYLHDANLKCISWDSDSNNAEMHLFDTWNQHEIEIIFVQTYVLLGENFHPWGNDTGINGWTIDSNLSAEASTFLHSKKIVVSDEAKREVLTVEIEFLSGDYMQIVCKELHVNTI